MFIFMMKIMEACAWSRLCMLLRYVTERMQNSYRGFLK